MGFGFDTLDLSKKIFVSASGGRDSTAMALVLWEYVRDTPRVDVSLLFINTRLNTSASKKTLEILSEYTGFPIVIARYEGEERVIDILKESFRVIPRAIEEKDHGRSHGYKELFRCCTVLKKQPVKQFYKQFPRGEIISLLGFKASDGSRHRRMGLGELRKKGTFYRDHTKMKTLYFYPLRDCTDSDVARILERHGFGDVKSSGCHTCPIFCVADWDDKDPDGARRSKLFAKRLGIELRAENQMPLRAFCSEVAE